MRLKNRERWLSRFYESGREAVGPGNAKGELFGFLIEPSRNSRKLREVLERGNVEKREPAEGTNFRLRGKNLPGGTRLVRMDQPYGAFAKALLEPQHYPDLRDSAGHPIAPYDVTAHSLAMLMDVKVTAVNTPFRYTID